MEAEIEYGTGYRAAAPPPQSKRVRHVWWSDGGLSKCGKAQLVEKTDDMSLRLCGSCARAMGRLERERAARARRWR
ncbi:hypothetical protein ACFC1B_07040 [Streptomyces xiamenensis]|uniref:hypothetical protein n=1 Tax=Streptomyces xiamenensis TaxID=408015 RepID=UPI0035E2E706